MNRAERRRQDREYERQIVQGIDPDEFDSGLLATLMRKTYQHVERAKQVGSVDLLMRFVYDGMDRSARRLRDIPTVCSKGCWYCCTIWVAAKAPEAIYFAKTLPRGAMPSFIGRLDDAMASVQGLSFDERGDMITPCPALVDNLCSNYANRPNVCRSASSIDADVCKRSYVELSGEDIPTPAAHIMVRGVFATALAGALKQSGLASGAYEFNSAVALVLKTPDIERRWLSGEDVFSGLPADPASVGDNSALEALRAEAFG